MRKASLLAVFSAVLPVLCLASDQRQKMPEIQLVNLAGQTIPGSAIYGRATVLNFWATWCGPCRMELPELQRLYDEKAGDGLAVIAVNVDVSAPAPILLQSMDRVRPMIERFVGASKLSLPVYLLDGPTQDALGVGSIPMTVLLDRDGGIVRVYTGYSPEAMKDLRAQLETLLAPAQRAGKGGR